MASSNPGKLAEIRALLQPLEIEVVSQGELGIPDAEEPHFTFLENALAKARHAAAASDSVELTHKESPARPAGPHAGSTASSSA